MPFVNPLIEALYATPEEWEAATNLRASESFRAGWRCARDNSTDEDWSGDWRRDDWALGFDMARQRKGNT